MSSHREAPSISKDPTADNTDVYAFRSPDDPSMITIISNFLPQQGPAAGPNFFEFDPLVTYYIYVDQTGDGTPDITYAFNFKTNYTADAQATYLYNSGPITSSGSGTSTSYTNYNVPQTYSVTKTQGGSTTTVASNVPVPPCNVGVHSTPNYSPRLDSPAITSLTGGGKVFAGQRADAFYVDLGSVFDLGTLRPLQFLHTGPLAPDFAKNSLAGLNVLTISLQLPITSVVVGGTAPTSVTANNAVIGIWSAANRAKSITRNPDGTVMAAAGSQQVSRLGNPLFNEVLVPITQKDAWNATPPSGDSAYVPGVIRPVLQTVLPSLYPLAFRNLANYAAGPIKDRPDLVAILLTGLPAGIIPGLKTTIGADDPGGAFATVGAKTKADMLRINLAIPVTASPNPLGVIGGDLQGFPNGRRLDDDVVAIELRAIAGATLPLVDSSGFVTDFAVNLVNDYAPDNNGPTLPSFPYQAPPNSGFAAAQGSYSTGP